MLGRYLTRGHIPFHRNTLVFGCPLAVCTVRQLLPRVIKSGRIKFGPLKGGEFGRCSDCYLVKIIAINV